MGRPVHSDRLDVRNWQLEGIRPLALVLLATLVVRLYLFVFTPVIASDATLYIHQAQLMAQGAWREAVAGDFEPLFPSFIFLFHTVLPDWELAGKLASLFFGVLAAIPLFLISKEIFGMRIAFGSGILFALHPYFARNSVEALTESTYLFFFLMSLWLALKALSRPGMRWFLLCAGAILLTRLTRTEGIWLFVAISLFLGLRGLRGPQRHEWTKGRPLIRFSFAFAIVMVPVFFYSAAVLGTSEFSAYKGLGWLFTALGQVPVILQESLSRLGNAEAEGTSAALMSEYYVFKFVYVFQPLLLFLAVFALLRRAVRQEYWNYFLLTSSVAFIYLGGVVLMGFIRGVEYTSSRFMMAPVVVALPWAVVTVELMAAWMERSRWAEGWLALTKKWSVIGHRSPVTGNEWGTLILAMIAIILGVRTVQPQRLDKLPIKEAGRWIAAQNLKDPVIVADDGRIAFYAKGRILPTNDTLEEKTLHEQNQIIRDIIHWAPSKKVRFVFLKGGLYGEAKTGVLASDVVKQIKEWRSPYGNAYTLLQLKTTRE